MKVSSVEQMREMDRRAVETLGISEVLLMENAGAASIQVLSREFGIAGRRGSEIVFVPQAETTEGRLSLNNKDTLLELA
jgi:NAD(P)H-hydrate repair Nnr-like enzyme with NAD(P)H-hydrate epimerase domain